MYHIGSAVKQVEKFNKVVWHKQEKLKGKNKKKENGIINWSTIDANLDLLTHESLSHYLTQNNKGLTKGSDCDERRSKRSDSVHAYIYIYNWM